MLNMQITDDLYIVADESCYKLCTLRKTEKVPEGIQEVLGFYCSISSAIESALDHKLRMSDFTSLSQVKEYIKEFEDFIRKELSVKAGLEKSKHLDTLDTLTDALGRSDEQSTEEVLADLREEGIDADNALVRLKKTQLSIAKEAKTSISEVSESKERKKTGKAKKNS